MKLFNRLEGIRDETVDAMLEWALNLHAKDAGSGEMRWHAPAFPISIVALVAISEAWIMLSSKGISMAKNIPFSEVWGRIESHAGRPFRQKRGGEFSYVVRNGAVLPDRTNRQLPRSHFEKAFRLVPLESTVPLQSLQGPSYLFAILMDDRIRNGDW